MKKPLELAASVIAERINAIETELVELHEAYKLLGGTYESETGEDAQPEPKRLAAPAKVAANEAETDGFGVTIDGVFVKLASERQANVVELLMQGDKGAIVPIDDIAGYYGGIKTRWYAEFGVINQKLKVANAVIANVRGTGYRLERVA